MLDMSFKYLCASVELVADTIISTFSSFCRLLPPSAIIVNYTLARSASTRHCVTDAT